MKNTKSQPSQPAIPTYVEIMKTNSNRGRRKSESDKQDNLCISDFLDYYNTASTRQENIRRVGTIPRSRRNKSVSASDCSLQKENNCDGNNKKKKMESSSFVVKVTTRFRLLRSKSHTSEKRREQNVQNPYHRTGRRCSVAASTKLIPRSKKLDDSKVQQSNSILGQTKQRFSRLRRNSQEKNSKEKRKHSTYHTPLPVHMRESESNHFVDKVTNKLCLFKSKSQASEVLRIEKFQEEFSRRRRSSVAATAAVVKNKESLGDRRHSQSGSENIHLNTGKCRGFSKQAEYKEGQRKMSIFTDETSF